MLASIVYFIGFFIFGVLMVGSWLVILIDILEEALRWESYLAMFLFTLETLFWGYSFEYHTPWPLIPAAAIIAIIVIIHLVYIKLNEYN